MILVVLVVVICGYNSLDAVKDGKETSQSLSAKNTSKKRVGTGRGEREERRGNNAMMRAQGPTVKWLVYIT